MCRHGRAVGIPHHEVLHGLELLDRTPFGDDGVPGRRSVVEDGVANAGGPPRVRSRTLAIRPMPTGAVSRRRGRRLVLRFFDYRARYVQVPVTASQALHSGFHDIPPVVREQQHLASLQLLHRLGCAQTLHICPGLLKGIFFPRWITTGQVLDYTQVPGCGAHKHQIPVGAKRQAFIDVRIDYLLDRGRQLHRIARPSSRSGETRPVAAPCPVLASRATHRRPLRDGRPVNDALTPPLQSGNSRDRGPMRVSRRSAPP